MMAMLPVSLFLLLVCVCFNHAQPTLVPYYPTANTLPHPIALPNRRPNVQTKTRSKTVTVVAPPPLQEPSTITSENWRAVGARRVLEAPSTSTSSPILLQLLRDAGVTLSPSNSRLMSVLDRIDFESLERMCRQRAGLSRASNIVQNVLDNQRGTQLDQIQSEMESMNRDSLFCSFLGKLGSPDDLFRDIETALSGVFPLKQKHY